MSDVNADCKPTKKMLTSRTGPNYDEYLYKNTREREKRVSGRNGEAYICGYESEYDGCPVGETLRLKNAAVGAATATADAVFICSGGGDNYYWKTIVVESECTFSEPVNRTFDNNLKLYKVGNRYCEKVSDIQTKIFLNDAQNFLNTLDNKLKPQNISLDINLSGYTTNSGISGSDLFNKIKVEIERKQFSETEKDFVIDAIQDAVSETNIIIENLQSKLENLSWQLVQTQAQLVLTQLITKANQTNIQELKSQLESLKTQVNDNMTKEQVMELVVEKLNTRNFNETEMETIKAMLSDAVNQLGFTDQRLQYQINDLTGRVDNLEIDMGQTKTELVKLKGYFAELKTLTGNQTQEIQNLIRDLENVTTTEEFKSKVQEIIKSSYATDEFKSAVADIIAAHEELKNMQIDLSMVKDTLYEHGQLIDENEAKLELARSNLEKADKDLAKKYDNLYTQLMIYSANFGMAIQNQKWVDEEIKETLQNVEYDLNDLCSSLSELDANKLDESTVQLLISHAIDEMQSELSSVDDELCANLNDQLNTIKDIILRLSAVEKKVEKMLSDISDIQGLNTAQQVAITQLQNDVGNYQTPEAVYQWIMENYSIFSQDQLNQIQEIAQRYIDAQLSSFNARMNRMDIERESERKILSAMSILNAFDAATKESVWRNKDGKFNTARLASDATAGVILGTAGGLISNKLIKKNQVKKGFENIGCYVGGQQIAEYGDEFTVGMN